MIQSLRKALLPEGASRDAYFLVSARSLRGFADGMVSVLLASYLSDLGFSSSRIGFLIAGTLLGSAALTLAVGLLGYRLTGRKILLYSCVLMFLTAAGFFGVTSFWPLFLIAVVGTLNPSAGDVSVFLPTEQALLTQTVQPKGRTGLFARYTLGGAFFGALGALASGLPIVVARHFHLDLLAAERSGFVIYGLTAVVVATLYARLSVETENERRSAGPLVKSRSLVLRLALLFSLDSFGSGFVVQSLLALWLFHRFGLSVETAGAIFFVSGMLNAFSQLGSPWLARRIGLIRTMAYTHLPANLFLMAAAFMPALWLSIACLLARTALSQMDVPARQSYVMAMVPAEERTAAASVTNVPRSLAQAISPALAGLMIARTDFGWPLLLAGGLKVLYDVLLLLQFRDRRPEEESSSSQTVGVN